jgi:hypothetical protein
MLGRTFLAALLAIAAVAAAHAQPLDGVYRGTSTLTKIVRTGAGEVNCPPIGHKIPLVITVAGATISALNLETQRTSSGTIASDGTFTITYGAGFWGGGPGSGVIPVTWSGRIRGSRIDGTFVVQPPSGQCSGVIAARK